MKVLSLFDGMSCGQVALQRAGIAVTRYLSSEIEKHSITVTQHNWPKTVQLGDVVRVREMAQVGLLPSIDLLLGGSPCQGFSSAGQGKGFDDPRSRLFFEFVRIKALVKPRWFLLENVKMKKADMNMISWWLGVEPVFINSADFSAQNRQRYYWTNIPVAPWRDRGILLDHVLESGWVADRPKSYCIDANYNKGTNFKRYFHRGSRQIVFRAEKIPAKPCESSANFLQRMMPDYWRKLTLNECERLQTLPDDYTAGVPECERYKMLGNGWTVDVIAHILRGIAA